MSFHFTIADCVQRTPEWYALRAGRLCASEANDMLAQGRGGAESKTRTKLVVRKALERVTGKSLERSFQSQAMQDGTEREALARSMYEARTGECLLTPGFVMHTAYLAGWSPDGVTDDFTGFVEIKCPEWHTHLDTLESQQVPTEYLRQMLHGGFWIAGAEWGDFVSYHPDFPAPLDLCIVRVTRTTLNLVAYETAARAFLEEVAAKVETLKRLGKAVV
jgi:predicted phage-related endonuclease